MAIARSKRKACSVAGLALVTPVSGAAAWGWATGDRWHAVRAIADVANERSPAFLVAAAARLRNVIATL
jgi:hypothetical protein